MPKLRVLARDAAAHQPVAQEGDLVDRTFDRLDDLEKVDAPRSAREAEAAAPATASASR